MARRRSNPFPVLVTVLAIPAVLLAVGWRVAAGHTVALPTAPPSGAVSPALRTPLLSVRRAPATLSRDLNLRALVASVEGMFSTLSGSECGAVSVDGLPVADVHAGAPLRPASNVKLFTAAVALDELGPSYTFHTELRGSASGGVVNGDLYMVGGGDPLLTSSWWHGSNPAYPPFNVTSIESLAAQLKASGVTRISGSVVGDASRYDGEWYPPTWDKSIRFSEGGPVSALLANDSREGPGTSSSDPSIGAARVLTRALRDAGVEVVGAARKGVAPTGSAVLVSIDSKPLTAVIAEMLTTSDNNTAEMLLKEIGHHATGRGTREDGLATVMQRLRAWNIPTDGVELHDGSGLSDDNRATCRAVLALLERHSPTDPIGAGLAVAGKKGGTLADAFTSSTLAGRLLGKTGTLYNYNDGAGGKPGAKALSGYVPLDGGGAIAFSLLLNGPTIAEKNQYTPIWTAFGNVLAGFPSGPTAAELAP